jgi:hypothetical protein
VVGEDDAFEISDEFPQAHGLGVAVWRSPGNAILAITDCRLDVVVTELVFGRRTRAGCQSLLRCARKLLPTTPLSSSSTGYVRSEDWQLAGHRGPIGSFPSCCYRVRF